MKCHLGTPITPINTSIFPLPHIVFCIKQWKIVFSFDLSAMLKYELKCNYLKSKREQILLLRKIYTKYICAPNAVLLNYSTTLCEPMQGALLSSP